MPAAKPGARRLQILQVLARMLEDPKGEKVTTAALAKELDVSEAALYRHFASKAQMFEGLIENPGMTRVLVGDALVNEDERLQARINQLHDRLEATLKQCLRVAATQGGGEPTGAAGTAPDPGPKANLLLCYVIGRWQQYAKSGFKRKPTELWEKQWPLLA